MLVPMELVKSKLDHLRGNLIDSVLGVSIAIGVLSQVFTFIRDYPNHVTVFTWVRAGYLGILFLIFLRRRSLSADLKLTMVVSLSFLLFSLSIYNLGIYSALKLFFVFGPVITIFILPRNFAIGLLMVFSVIYVHFSWRLISGTQAYIIVPSDLETNIFQWMGEFSSSLIFTISIIIFIRRFRSELTSSISELEWKNMQLEQNRSEIMDFNTNLEQVIDQKTVDLRKAVDDLAAQNFELDIINNGIKVYNEDLAAATAQLKMVRERQVISDKLSSLGLLTAGVCHEIKNPINHLHGSVKILENHLRMNGATAEHFKLLDIIRTGTDRIKTITDSLNQFDHVSDQAEGMVDLVVVVQNCRKILGHLVTPGIAFDFNPSCAAAEIPVSSDLLHQVILNVMQNALEAIEDKGIVNVNLILAENRAMIEIADNGCGIPEGIRPLVTDPFFTTKATGSHTGLGLYHVQKLMSSAGGKLFIDSRPAHGTIVRLVFYTKVVVLK